MRSSFALCLEVLVAAVALISFTAAADTFAVFKSMDRGQTWSRADAGMPERSRINAFGSVDGTLLAGTDSGIFTTTHEALSWQRTQGAAMSSGRITSFATLGQRVFAGTDGKGLLASSDRGGSWVAEPSFPSTKVRCLLTHGGEIYAGTDSNGVFASKDAGQRWIHISAGLPSQAQIFALSAVRGRLFAGLYSQGLYAWDEVKESWGKIGAVTPLALTSVQDALIVGHNPGGIDASEDGGVSWSKGEASGPAIGLPETIFSDVAGELTPYAPVWGLGSDDHLALAGASAGIYYSENRGRTWARARNGLPERSPGLTFLLTPRLILAGTLMRGSDGGGAEVPLPGRSPTNRTSSPNAIRR